MEITRAKLRVVVVVAKSAVEVLLVGAPLLWPTWTNQPQETDCNHLSPRKGDLDVLQLQSLVFSPLRLRRRELNLTRQWEHLPQDEHAGKPTPMGHKRRECDV
jgi:hypothetical protein